MQPDGRRRADRRPEHALAVGRPERLPRRPEPDVTHLARVRGVRPRPARRRPLVRRPRGHPDQGRLRPRPDPGEQPLAAPVGPRLLRDGDDVGGDVAATTWTAGACSRSAPRPRQADVLIVAGTLTTKMAGPLVRLWEQMPEPKWCVAMGDCTCSGGRYKRSYATVEGIDRVMPVDVYVPGCPPRPEGLIYGMMKLQQLVKDRRGHWPERADRPDRPGRTSERWTPPSSAGWRRASATALIGAGPPAPRRDRDPDRRRATSRTSSATLHDEPDLPVRPARRPRRRRHRRRRCRSSTTSGATTSAGLAAGHRRRPVARRPARPLGDLPLAGRRVDGARGLRHVRDHVRGQPRPAPDLHAARLPELPAPQGLLPARRRRALAGRRRPPHGAVPRAAQRAAPATTIRKVRA